MKTIIFLWVIVLNAVPLGAQSFEKVVFDRTSDEGYYLALLPATGEVQGVLLLFPGFGQPAESVFSESKLPNVAYANNLLTIILANGPKLHADSALIQRISQAVSDIQTRYDVAPDRFAVGGFSAGGTIALRYSEYCYDPNYEMLLRPFAVFTVDAPVDLFDIWTYFERETKKDFSEAGVNEAKFASQLMQEEIGTPTENAARYSELTPFDRQLDQPGNERFLQDVPMRTYHDIDVAWLLNQRRRSLLDSNALAASELINRLLLLGNERAEFVQAQQPGYRSDGTRHPHSWSIVDEVELIRWVLESLSE